MTIALEVRDLAVEIGGRVVVEGLSLDLRSGEKIGMVGRNGAGKTSTLRVLAGETRDRVGDAILDAPGADLAVLDQGGVNRLLRGGDTHPSLLRRRRRCTMPRS